MTSAPVYVSAAGLACPVGMTWACACAAMRAGITRKSSSAYRDNQGREIVASSLRDLLSEDALYEERWLFLLTHALRDVTRHRGGPVVLQRMPLFLTLPPARGGQAYSAAFACEALSRTLGLRLSPDNLHLLTGAWRSPTRRATAKCWPRFPMCVSAHHRRPPGPCQCRIPTRRLPRIYRTEARP